MAGGDGSQAIVAAIAAERGLPYACIPAGTRNHFALDLGVDRDDVVGALDAFVDGGERTVDLAEVNGRVFVNNVSLGLYAEAVQREGYRDAKLRTLLDTVPDVLGPDGGGARPALDRAGRARRTTPGAAVLVSNNRYRLGRAVGSGTRPRIDDGLLGITVFGAPAGRGEGGRSLQRPWREWSAPDFEVDADRPVARRNRRRGARARPAAALSHPARRPARADRAQAPGRLALGHGARGRLGGRVELARIAVASPETRNPNTKEARMDLMEITEKERLSREDAAARLHALADALAKHNDVEFDRGGMHFKVHVADEVDFKLEIEIEDDERELEIELKW